MPEPTGTADLVTTGADVYTMDAARRWAGAVAIRGDRIVAVGTEPDVRERFPTSVQRTQHDFLLSDELIHRDRKAALAGAQQDHGQGARSRALDQRREQPRECNQRHRP